MCFQTQSTTELNQKPIRLQGVYMGGKYLCKNLGVKEGGGRLLEGGVFLEVYSISWRTVVRHM